MLIDSDKNQYENIYIILKLGFNKLDSYDHLVIITYISV